MKHIRRLIALMMVVLLFTTAFNVSAMAIKKPSGKSARNTDVQKIVPGNWYDLKDVPQEFRFTLSKDSLVTVEWSMSSVRVFIWNFSLKDKYVGQVFSRDTKAGSDVLVIKKGTYIMDNGVGGSSEGYEGKKIGKVKLTISKLNDKKNYCPSRAVALKKNTKCTYGTTPMNLYDTFWYKITTTKKQKITVKTSDKYCSCSILYPDFNSVPMESYGSQTRKTMEALPAGTYYLTVPAPRRCSMYVAETETFWWE